MAYLIHLNDNIVHIASNETEKNELNISFPPYEAIEISNADFLNLKKNISYATIIDENVSYTNFITTFNAEDLKTYLDGLKNKLKSFLRVPSNNSKSLNTQIQNYFDYLNTLNISTITFPLNKSWEQYCDDNSISYLHPLQIP